FPSRFAVTMGLAALADWLFYSERVGISLVLFAVALTACSLLANRAASSGRRALLAVAIVVAGIIPAIEEINPLSLGLLVLALGVAISIGTNPGLYGLADRTRALRELFLIGPFRLIRDTAASFSVPAVAAGFAVWFIPIVLSSIFVALFASANPM